MAKGLHGRSSKGSKKLGEFFNLSQYSRTQKIVVIAVVFACIGVATLLVSKAATFVASLEPENTGVTGPAVAITGDNTASNGGYVQFKAAGTSGSDPLCTWPGNANHNFPCPADTGAPAGTTFTTSGNCNTNNITVSGTYTGCLWSNGLLVNASNVTITNSKITGDAGDGGLWVQSGSNIHVSYTTFDYTDQGAYSSTRQTRAHCSGNVTALGSNLTLDHISSYGWSDGPRLDTNQTTQNSYIEGCACHSGPAACPDWPADSAHDDHADDFQCFGCGPGAVINHNTINDGYNTVVKMASADMTFAADGGEGSTWTNNLFVAGPNDVGLAGGALDNRLDSGGINSGTVIVRNNVFIAGYFGTGGKGDPIPCNGPNRGGAQYFVSGNMLTDGTAVNADGNPGNCTVNGT